MIRPIRVRDIPSGPPSVLSRTQSAALYYIAGGLLSDLLSDAKFILCVPSPLSGYYTVI